MKNIGIEKITLNIGVGGPGDNMEKATKLLKTLTGLEPKKTSSPKRIPSWGVRPGLAIACKVTVRGKEKCKKLLDRLLYANHHKIAARKFDQQGNFSFGVEEYINIKDLEYDPSIGIIGLEAAVTLTRPGFRVKKRKLQAAKVGQKHRISKEEAIKYIQEEFKAEVVS